MVILCNTLGSVSEAELPRRGRASTCRSRRALSLLTDSAACAILAIDASLTARTDSEAKHDAFNQSPNRPTRKDATASFSIPVARNAREQRAERTGFQVRNKALSLQSRSAAVPGHWQKWSGRECVYGRRAENRHALAFDRQRGSVGFGCFDGFFRLAVRALTGPGDSATGQGQRERAHTEDNGGRRREIPGEVCAVDGGI